jgi:hypothetical protein
MLRSGNIVLLTLRFLDVAKFTNLTPLSLLISCKLSFPLVSLKMSSLPDLWQYKAFILSTHEELSSEVMPCICNLYSDWLQAGDNTNPTIYHAG